MSGRSRTLKIEILGDAAGGQRALDAIGQSADGLGKHLSNVASIAGGFIVAQGLLKLPDLFNSAVTAGSNLSESINAVNQIFGDSAQQILDWGETSANSFGLSQRAFNDLAVPLGAGLKNAGLDMDDVSNHTIALTERAADMASVFNTDVDEALAAIQAGLRGEADPLERFGVGLSAAAVQGEALAMTGKSVASELTSQELALARVNLIMKQTEDTAGDFTNTSDGVANSARIAAARQEELAATIGTQLLPVQQAITQAKLEFLELLAEHVIPVVLEYGEKLGDLAERLGGPLNDAFVLIRDGVQTFAEALSGDWTDAEGIRGVHRVIGNLGEIIAEGVELVEDLQERMEDLGEALEPVTDLWRGWSEDLRESVVDIAEFVGNVDSLPELLDGISSGLQNISWSDITSGLSGIGGDIVAAVSESLDNAGWDEVRGKVSSGIASGFTFTSDSAQELVDGIATAFEETDWTAVRTAVSEGLFGGIESAEGLGQRVVDGLSTQFEDVDWTTLSESLRTGIATAIEDADAIGQEVIDWIAEGLGEGADWLAVGSAIRSGIVAGLAAVSGIAGISVAIIDAIAQALIEEEGDWSSVGENMWERISEGLSSAVGVGETIATWIATNLEEVDWTEAAQTIGDGISSAFTSVEGVTAGLVERIQEELNETDWSGNTESLTDGLRGMFEDAFGDIDLEETLRDAGFQLTPEAIFGDGGLVEMLEDVGDEFDDFVKVLEDELGPAVDDVREAWEAWEPILRPLAGLMLDIAGSGIVTIITALIQPALLAAEALKLLFEWFSLVAEVVQRVGEHVQAGIEIFGTLWTTFQEGIEVIGGFVSDTGSKLGEWASTAQEKGGEFKSNVLDPIGELVTEGAGKLGELATNGAGKLGELASGGASEAQNLYNSVTGKIGEMVSTATTTIGGLPGRAASAIGDLSGTLAQAGRDLIQGFIDGIQEMIPSVDGILGGLTDRLSQVKGPPERDRILLRPSGQWVIQGFIDGILDEVPNVERTLLDITEGVVETIEEGFDNKLGDLGVKSSEVADAIVEGASEDLGRLPELVGNITDEVLVELARMMEEVRGELQLARIVGDEEEIAKLEERIGTIDAIITEWALSTGQKVSDVQAKFAEGIGEDALQAWRDSFKDLDEIASGETQEKLLQTIEDLQNELKVALERGAPQEVIDAIKADIAAAEAELEAVGEIAGTAVVKGIRNEQLHDKLREEAKKAAEEFQEQLADEWDQRMQNLLDPERTAETLNEQIDRIAEEIRMGEILGAPEEWLEERRAALEAAQEEEAHFWKDLALKASEGAVDPEVLKEIGAAGNEMFQAFLEDFVGPERAKLIVSQIPKVVGPAIDELKKRFAEAPEIAGQFVDDLVKGVKDGTWSWEDVMEVLSVLPRDELIPILEELSEKFGIDLTEAMIGTDIEARNFAEGGLAAVNAALAETKAKTDAAKDALLGFNEEIAKQGSGGVGVVTSAGGSGGGGGGGGGGGSSSGGGSFSGDMSSRQFEAVDSSHEYVDTVRILEGSHDWERRVDRALAAGNRVIVWRRAQDDSGHTYIETVQVLYPTQGAVDLRRRGEGRERAREEFDFLIDPNAGLGNQRGRGGQGGGSGPGRGGPGGNTFNINVNVESEDPERIAAAVDFTMREIANDPALVGSF